MKLYHIITLLLTCICLTACNRSAQLTVINKSLSTLTNIVASGSGFSQPLGTLAPSKQLQVTITPRGESDLKLVFDADGKHFTPKEQSYFEGGYEVSARISPDYSVTIDAKIPKY